ncbi:MAG: 4-carboxymuconolactone decarboxylase [Armatimonadota bacterium]|nr:4-carboxymuconolactone decarboxylase [Armatimonadota bacterium]MDW8155015.1 4-carboxymuconolactone decarboxylase [Armatimonadota bacterium]
MSRFEEGLQVRKAVMGEEYVERSFQEADEFTRPFQELVTEYAWGAVWARPGLPRKVRSLLTVAVTAALNRPHELRLHLRGALRNGCTPEEIRETLLQVAVYAGMPAGLDAFRVAREVLEEARGA